MFLKRFYFCQGLVPLTWFSVTPALFLHELHARPPGVCLGEKHHLNSALYAPSALCALENKSRKRRLLLREISLGKCDSQKNVQRTMGLLNCQMDIDMPPYGVVTSLLVLA